MEIKPVYSELMFGRQWLMQMGEAAERQGLPLQYCMALPRNVMASLEIPAVTQVLFHILSCTYHGIPHCSAPVFDELSRRSELVLTIC